MLLACVCYLLARVRCGVVSARGGLLLAASASCVRECTWKRSFWLINTLFLRAVGPLAMRSPRSSNAKSIFSSAAGAGSVAAAAAAEGASAGVMGGDSGAAPGERKSESRRFFFSAGGGLVAVIRKSNSASAMWRSVKMPANGNARRKSRRETEPSPRYSQSQSESV